MMNIQGTIMDLAKKECCRRVSKMDSSACCRTWSVAIVLVTLLCFIPSVKSRRDNSFEMKIPATEPLTLSWGISDTTAYVGKLFTYTLPNDAFEGNIVRYDIAEVGKDALPSWLTFNELKTELKGIPGPEDKGHIYLEVKVSGDGNSQSEDVFSIEVRDDTNGPVGSVQSLGENAPKVVRCKRDEPQTIVTVVVDCDLYQMKPGVKMNILNSMAGHLNLAPEMLKLMPVGNKPMFDIGALVVGPGNVKVPRTGGTLVSWIVGCGQVDNDHVSTLQQMESAAANGDLTSAVGHDIIGWHVTNTRFQAKPRRRRQATATATMTPPAPTTVIAATSAKHVSASTLSITPTKTNQVKATAMPDNKDKTTSSSSETITPSSTKKITSSSSTTTEKLPIKAYTMTTSSVTTTGIAPTTTSTTTSSTMATTPEPTTASTTEHNTLKLKPKPTSEPLCPKHGEKKSPMVKNKLRNMNIPSGSINRKKLAEDTFYDCYNYHTSDLGLEITFTNGEALPDGFWLKLHKRASRPYIILMNPLNVDAGSYTFTLTATNNHSKSMSQNFVVVVEGEDMASSPPSHELSMSIDTNYDKFMSSLDNRIELSNKVSRIFGDKNANSLTVTRLEEGSVVYAWTNHSLSGSDCPTDDLKTLVNKMFNEDGTLTENAQHALQPYKVSSAAAHPLGACTNNPDFPSRMTKRVTLTTTENPMMTKDKKMSPTIQPSIKYTDMPKTTPKIMPKSSPGSATESTTVAVAAAGVGSGVSDIWITTVVPAIVVVIVLIIALIIACCLYRKRRKGKMKLEDKEKFSNNKGVPVIFADEYEEKPNDSTRPLILEDEKPPMPPPEYQRASSESSGNSNSTQPIEDKDIEEIEMDSELSPLYSPPPPVTASNNSKPPHVQSSRGPPPYVPP